MQKFVIKTIKAKMLILLLPMIVLSLLLLSLISYESSKKLIQFEVDNKMNYKLEHVLTTVQKSLTSHGQIPDSLARTIEIAGAQLSPDQYKEILPKYVGLNAETLGAGVWFEPYKYKSELKYFGPYAYRDNDSIVYTDDYNTPEYDYPHWDWYTMANNTKERIVWSPPYYDDVSKKTMVTTSAPFYDKNQQFLGVTTADIDLSILQKMINDIKIGENGRAFLIDNSGLYLTNPDQSKIMKNKITEDENRSLATLGKEMLNSQKSKGSYTEKDGKNIVYYKTIPEVGWVLSVMVPEKRIG